MPFITLTTDFGVKDYYVGALKGALFSTLDDAKIVDISHSISPFHTIEASYIIKNAYKNFPKGTIHIIGVDSGETPETKHLLVHLDGHYFILSDNGVLSLITSEIEPDEIFQLVTLNEESTNFPALDIFVKVAAHIARGGQPEVVGKLIDSMKEMKQEKPNLNQQKNKIIGNVLYIDNYGNVITNIKQEFFNTIRQNRNFVINARTTRFTEIYSTYSSAINFSMEKGKREEDGKKLALFNSAGYIELAVYKSNSKTVGSASTLFGLELRDTVTISFF